MNTDERQTALPPGIHIESEDLMLYTLELLTPREAQEIDTHLDGCPLCREELAEVRADLGIYALASVPMQTVPAGSRERLLASVDRERRTFGRLHLAAVPDPGQRDRSERAQERVQTPGRPSEILAGNGLGKPSRGAGNGPGRLAPWLGWAVAAGLFFVAGHFHRETKTMHQQLLDQGQQVAALAGDSEHAREVVAALTDPGAQRVTLTLAKAPHSPEPTGRATYLPTRGTLIFVASHLAPLPAGKTYELWIIPANGGAPRPAGTFHPDELGNASVVRASLAEPVAAKAFGVTIEAEGGATTPTMPILLAGS